MIIITISDIHGHVHIGNSTAQVLQNADLLLMAGDITNFGNAYSAEVIISKFKPYIQNIYAVTGNCDRSSVANWLEKENISVEDGIKKLMGLQLYGIGGTLSAYGLETEYKAMTGVLKKIAFPWILVTHQPPYGTEIDTVSASHHVGSPVITQIIQKYKPVISFSGHVHEAPGVDKINDTIVANPGPFADGGYIYTDVNISKAVIRTCQLRYF